MPHILLFAIVIVVIKLYILNGLVPGGGRERVREVEEKRGSETGPRTKGQRREQCVCACVRACMRARVNT